MKKMFFVFILIMTNSLLFSQSEIMRFLSMGFNAQHEQRGSASYYNYFFYGYEDYSEALVFSDHVELRIGAMSFYPYARIIHEFPPRQYSMKL